MNVHVWTGGQKEWFARQLSCSRCWRRCTHFGWRQAYYDPVIVCGHCGAINHRRGAAGASRRRALEYRRGFVEWLLAGSPKLDLTPYLQEP